MEHYALDKGLRLGDVQVGVPLEEALRGAVAFNHNVEQQTDIDGPIIDDAKPGRNICLTHPITGAEHTLTVHDVDEETTDFSRYMPSGFVLPTCYTTLTYLLSPTLRRMKFICATATAAILRGA